MATRELPAPAIVDFALAMLVHIPKRSWRIGGIISAIVLSSFAHAAEPASGFNSEGVPYIGDVDAPVVLTEFSDYLCPFCARYHSSTLPELVKRYVAPGLLRIEFRHFPLSRLHPTATQGHIAAACAGEQGIEQFWSFHNLLFERQREWIDLKDPSAFLESVGSELKLNLSQWRECQSTGRQTNQVQRDIALAESASFSGTPSFQLRSVSNSELVSPLIGARAAAVFFKYIDALLAGEQPPKPQESRKPTLPDWAKSEALALDPQRKGYTISGDPSIGEQAARLVIVEFTDYQCPACRRHAVQTQPLVDEVLIDTGKVRWVHKNLPLAEHANALAAAAAAECAGRQGFFRPMHYTLFKNQALWATAPVPDDPIVQLATELDLNLGQFAECIDSRNSLEPVFRNVLEATSVTSATPVFVLLDGESGRTIRGVREPQRFIELVESQLNRVLSKNSENPSISTDE